MNPFKRRHPQKPTGHLATLYEDGLGLYQAWYFERRFEEEMSRASRYGLPFALVLIAFEEQSRNRLAAAASRIARSVRTFDIAGVVDAGLYAVCLVHCDEEGARAVEQRLAEELEQFHPRLGSALFPGDGVSQAASMLALARERLKTSEAA